jgi:hypothetical protein
MKRLAALVPLTAAAAFMTATVLSGPVAANEPNRAGVVVTFGDGRSETACVEFAEPEISGAELLSRAGFPVVTAAGSGGAAVCDIGGSGCRDPNDCFCECHGSDCRYWAYYTLEEGAWRYAAIGSSQRKVRDGDVDGWAWGSGSIGSGARPELRTFEEICPPPLPTATAVPANPTESAESAVTPPVEEEATPAATVAAGPTPTFFIPGPDTTFPPALRQLAKLPTALSRWSGEEGKGEKSGSGGDFPWEIPVFGIGAAVLLGTALLLAKRRAGG